MIEKPQTQAIGNAESGSNISQVGALPLTDGWRGFARRNRNPIGALLMFFAFWAILLVIGRGVFFRPEAYTSLFTMMPITILMATAVVFTTTSGAIDLSYVSTMGLGAWGFAVLAKNLDNPWLGLLLAIILGVLVGLLNSTLVLKFRLTPLIATLGVNFFIRGLVNILSNAKSIPLPDIEVTSFFQVCCSTTIGSIPNQMWWALLFAGITWALYSKHTFGKHIHIIGDNEESAREMGISISRTKAFAYIYTAVAASIAGALIVCILRTFWPDTGAGLLLPILTAVFVGGNPLIGGLGTVIGALIGSFTVTFIETGIIAAGFTDVYTGFVYGIVLIISLLGFRTSKR